MKKKPVISSPKPIKSNKLAVLEVHTASSSSSKASSESEKEIQGSESQNTPPKKIWIFKFRGKDSSETFHRKRIAAKLYRKQKLKNADSPYKEKQSPTPKVSGKCFNCGKKGHLRTKCENKDRTLTNTIVCKEPPSTSRPKIQAPQIVVPEATSTRQKKDVTVNDL